MLAALLLPAAQDMPDDIVVTGRLLQRKVGAQTNGKVRVTASGTDRTACEAMVACGSIYARAHADQGMEERE